MPVFSRLQKFPACRISSNMAFVYEISRSGNHVKVVGTGKITIANCIRIIRSVLSDPRYRSNSTALIDLNDAVFTYRDKDEVIKIAKTLEAVQALLTNRIAIVAKRSTLFPSEIFSLYIRQATHIKIRVFMTRTSAMAYCRKGRCATGKAEHPSSDNAPAGA